jgi:uncharacterized protein (TIGR01244 family)
MGLGLMGLTSNQAAATDPPPAASDPNPATPLGEVQPLEIGQIINVHQCGPVLMAGQPTPTDFDLLAKRGVKKIVTFRTDGEVQWDERARAAEVGIEFLEIPYASIESLTDEVFAESRKVIRQAKGEPIFLHCGAATRVAAVWLAYRVLDQGVDLEIATREAEKIGLRSPKLKSRVEEYIRSQQ